MPNACVAAQHAHVPFHAAEAGPTQQRAKQMARIAVRDSIAVCRPDVIYELLLSCYKTDTVHVA